MFIELHDQEQGVIGGHAHCYHTHYPAHILVVELGHQRCFRDEFPFGTTQPYCAAAADAAAAITHTRFDRDHDGNVAPLLVEGLAYLTTKPRKSDQLRIVFALEFTVLSHTFRR